ncbi:MAG: hypothetical protein ACPGXY_04835 [Alphaproteobacteria bacterium]
MKNQLESLADSSTDAQIAVAAGYLLKKHKGFESLRYWQLCMWDAWLRKDSAKNPNGMKSLVALFCIPELTLQQALYRKKKKERKG